MSSILQKSQVIHDSKYAYPSGYFLHELEGTGLLASEILRKSFYRYLGLTKEFLAGTILNSKGQEEKLNAKSISKQNINLDAIGTVLKSWTFMRLLVHTEDLNFFRSQLHDLFETINDGLICCRKISVQKFPLFVDHLSNYRNQYVNALLNVLHGLALEISVLPVAALTNEVKHESCILESLEKV